MNAAQEAGRRDRDAARARRNDLAAIAADTAERVAAAYARGRALDLPADCRAALTSRNTIAAVITARDAATSWTQAQTEHEHTSYYGAATVRRWRALWTGALRTARHRHLDEGGRPSTLAHVCAVRRKP